MKKNIALLFLYLLVYTCCFSQMRTEILPQSKLGDALSGNIPEIVLPRFPLAEIERLDKEDQLRGRVPKISRDIITKINLQNSGQWNYVSSGRVWRLEITSHEAVALIPLFDSLYLPEGSTLHFYTPDGKQILGAFTNFNTPQIRSFSCGIIWSESFVMEYFEPNTHSGEGILDLYRVGYGYRGLRSSGQIDTSIECQVNVICPEGDNWREQIRSVVQLIVHTDSDSSENYCSGVLINNVKKDGTPYILSAMHCLNGVTLPSDFGTFVFTFHFQDSLCQGPDPTIPGVTQIFGCTKIATSNDNFGQTGSDFMLLEMLQKPDNADSACYAGWYNGPATPQSGVCIHHPGGGPKKISTYVALAFSTSWGQIVPDTHWGVIWDSSAANPGVTAPGSSGSPLFNQEGLVVGHLTGGTSCCPEAGTCITEQQQAFPWGPDLFGQVFFDWDSDGVDSNEQLKPWLDPDNTGTTTLPGWCPNNSAIASIAVNPFFMELMPNPTNGILKLLFNTNEEKNIRIFDALGRTIMALQSHEMNVAIDLSAYSKGLYIIEAGNANGNNVQKLILN
jgi:hypothetical protein